MNSPITPAHRALAAQIGATTSANPITPDGEEACAQMIANFCAAAVGAHSFVFETAHTERDQREITSLLIALNHAESEWQAQAALVKASVEREAKASELSEVRRLSLEDLAAEKAHAEEVWQKRNDALAAQVAMLLEAGEALREYLVAEVGPINDIPDGIFGRFCFCLAATPATASAELAELREKVSQLKAALELGQENCDAVYEDLRAERDEARNGLEMSAKVIQAGDNERRKLCEELAALESVRQDKARLDWLDAQCRGVEFFTMDGPFENAPPRQFFKVDGIGLEKARDSLRSAIDAAMEAKP